jgi:hypothetical protein
MKKLLNILLLSAAILLSGCEEDSPYSGYRVNFSFDSTIHPYNQARSYGQYICVRRGANIGLYTLTDATGKTQTISIPQIQIQQNTFYYGLGGLIIGTPTACDGKLWAFDQACPECGTANNRVKIDYVMGHATCPRCSVKFDLNSGGIAIEGKSRPLWRYRVFDTGSDVVIQN